MFAKQFERQLMFHSSRRCIRHSSCSQHLEEAVFCMISKVVLTALKEYFRVRTWLVRYIIEAITPLLIFEHSILSSDSWMKAMKRKHKSYTFPTRISFMFYKFQVQVYGTPNHLWVGYF